ncbi:MAG: glycosyltransferase family 2 protein [Thermoleophilia bacterium]|nr:glycosyltransferase family 2 protein [Thermoleophilia bacterium]
MAAPARERPLVTVVVLCHNYAHFLPESVESALAQTYEPLEVIVVDDGSTDDSLAVARRYADRVRIETQPNMGLERSCNRAVRELVRGDYFCFLSADDAFAPRYVERLWEALQRSPDAAYAYCRPLLFGAREGPMRCLPFSAYFLVKRTNFVNASALTARADYLAVGGYAEDLGQHALEDWDFWLRMLARGRRGTYVREPLLRWRRHDAGSRNPEQGERERAALDHVRARHHELAERMSDVRGRMYYALDFALAAADLALGYSRWPRLVRRYERASWRRYRRWHAPDAASRR